MTDKPIRVMAPGSPALVGGDIPAVILGFDVAPNLCLRYRVEWWDGRCRRDEWLNDVSVKPVAGAKWLQISPASDSPQREA